MPKQAKKDKEKSLESVLWDCRNDLRGIGSPEKNRDSVISLVFLKFAGDKFEKRYNEIKEQYGDNEVFLNKPSFYNSENVYYLKENCRWQYLVDNASANDIALKIDKAMADIEDDNPSLRGALPLNIFTSLGASKEKIKSLIDDINQISAERFQEQDLIGRVYEYFLRAYAAAGTKEDGEFYTPASVVKLIAEMIEPYSGTVYDPCCGSGGMFVQSLKFVERHNGNKKEVSVIGQESNPDTWRLCKMNLAIRGIAHDLGDKNDSTFTNDLHKDRDHQINYIMANPPFNLKDWRTEDGLVNDPRFRGIAIPSTKNANYAWILHMLSKLDINNGVAGFLLANGALNAGQVNHDNEYKIRKAIVDQDRVEAIIVLPRDMFYTTDISVTLWILNMNKGAGERGGRQLRDRKNEILFLDLRKWNENIEETLIDKGKKKKKVAFTDKQIEKVKEVYENWRSSDRSKYEDVPEFCKSATLDEIRAQDYSLAPSKYIEFIDHDLEIDYEKEMSRIQNEMKDVLVKEKESQKMLEESFKGIGYDID